MVLRQGFTLLRHTHTLAANARLTPTNWHLPAPLCPQDLHRLSPGALQEPSGGGERGAQHMIQGREGALQLQQENNWGEARGSQAYQSRGGMQVPCRGPNEGGQGGSQHMSHRREGALRLQQDIGGRQGVCGHIHLCGETKVPSRPESH